MGFSFKRITSSVGRAVSDVTNVALVEPVKTVLIPFYKQTAEFATSPTGLAITGAALTAGGSAGVGAVVGGVGTYRQLSENAKAQQAYIDAMNNAAASRQQTALFDAGGFTPSAGGGNVTLDRGTVAPNYTLLIAGFLGVGALLLLKGRR